MLAMPNSLLPFCLGATYDALPHDNHPQTYTDSVFIQNHLVIYVVKLCAQQLIFLVPGRLPISRKDSLTTRKFDSVLQAFLTTLQTFLFSYSVSESLQHHRNFVRPGTKIKKSTKNLTLAFCTYPLTGKFCLISKLS